MKSSFKHFNKTAACRLKLGLTQEQLAMELGISVSMVKMVESNQRRLSMEKLAQVARMEQDFDMLQQGQLTASPVLKQLHGHAAERQVKNMEYLILRCRYRAMALKRQLKKMKQEHDALRTTVLNQEAMQAMRPGKNGPADNIKLNMPGMLKKLMSCSLQAQEMTRKRIALLEAEAMMYQSIIRGDVFTNENPISSTIKQTGMD